MLKPKRRWHVQETDQDEVNKMTQAYDMHPIIANILALRGIKSNEDIKRFLHTDESIFYDPYLLDDMKKAVKRIQSAILKNEKILIYGDYDADGVTSTSILYKTLKKLNANFAYYIPNRFSEGYGLNKNAIEKAANQGFKLMITVDTGISAVDEAKFAKELGICLIITDHHEPPEIMPDAYAIINPKKKTDNYPFKFLAGVGVTFKLTHALLGRLPVEYMDIASIGTISDLVPLIDENRAIASLGLQQMSTTNNIGLKALLEKNGLANKEVSAGQIGFIIGPRINASGRLDTANNAVRLFITNDPKEADELAESLNNINQQRQAIVENITNEANELILSSNMENDKVIILAKEGWNEGVIGIVASRILEKYYKPTIVLSIDAETGMAKGSARSIEGFDIYKALTAVKEYITNFGGHTAAAGLTIKEENISIFRVSLNKVADEWLVEEDFIPIEKVDVVCDIHDIDIGLIKQIDSLAPFGIGNPSPKFLIDQVEITNILSLGNSKQHLKLHLEGENKSLEALFFRMGNLIKDIAPYSHAQLLGELTINEWQGKMNPQVIIKDIHIPSLQVFDWRDANWMKRLQHVTRDGIIFIDGKKSISLEGVTDSMVTVAYDDNTMVKKDEIKNIIFLHLPPSTQHVEKILKEFRHIERIYCVFEHEKNTKFNKFMNRNYFKQVYLTLKQNNSLLSLKRAELYFKNLGISSEILKFILDVFSELGFIIVEDDKISIHTDPDKKDLTESLLYRHYQEYEQLKELFVYSNHQKLKNWFERYR